MRISILHSEKLQAVVLAIRGFDRELQGQIRRATKQIGQPDWQSALHAQASTTMETRVLAATGRMTVSNQNVTLKSAAIGRPLSGGASPSLLARGVEHGAIPRVETITQRSRKGNRYTARRRVNAWARPVNRSGYVFYPAAARMIPRFAALWAQTTVRTIHEAFEKGH